MLEHRHYLDPHELEVAQHRLTVNLVQLAVLNAELSRITHQVSVDGSTLSRHYRLMETRYCHLRKESADVGI